MASITWQSTFPASQLNGDGSHSIVGHAAYTLGTGETWLSADLRDGDNGAGMNKDTPMAGVCSGAIANVQPGTYNVTAYLTYRRANGTVGTVNSASGQVVVGS